MLGMIKALILSSLWSATCWAHGTDRISRHLLTDDLSTVVVLADAPTTEGPFDEEDSDYINSPDMTMAAKAGSSNVTEDREAVLMGVPLTLDITLYNISDGMTSRELSDVEVFLWHCDALGIYSAVESQMQTENTEGQKWLRGTQVTDANGKVSFQTILPGWYSGRTIHYHIRFRLPGATSYVGTSQLFISDADLKTYQCIFPYSQATMSQTPLETDMIYSGMSSDVAELLTLTLNGSLEEGFTSSVSLGLTGEETSGGGGGDGGGPPGDGGGPPPEGPPPGDGGGPSGDNGVAFSCDAIDGNTSEEGSDASSWLGWSSAVVMFNVAAVLLILV